MTQFYDVYINFFIRHVQIKDQIINMVIFSLFLRCLLRKEVGDDYSFKSSQPMPRNHTAMHTHECNCASYASDKVNGHFFVVNEVYPNTSKYF